jgi:hypothetical protein
MSLTKYASYEAAEVLDLKGSKERVRTASLAKLSDFEDFRTEDGFLYARIRAISSRVNKNHDGWPSIELAGGQDIFDRFSKVAHARNLPSFIAAADPKVEYGYSTFLGKPIFVDHNNTDPTRARGVIVDAKLHVEDHRTASELDSYYATAPDEHMPPTWVELLLEVDAKSFPKLAAAVIEGSRDPDKGIDGFSMGCDVERSVCNICKNAATSPEEYCTHIRLKGHPFRVLDPKTGKHETKKSYEDCYGVKFFEISAVFDPADETALLRDAIYKEAGEVKSKFQVEAATKTAQNPPPQVDLPHLPQEVDTLRNEEVCPICGSTMDDENCGVCGYISPPEGFDNPNLEKAQQERDDPQESEGPPGSQEPQFADADQTLSEGTSNQPSFAHVKNDMSWDLETPHTAASNDQQTPIVPNKGPATDEPDEDVLEDPQEPVTSRVRTAQDFIAAAGATPRRKMTDHTADAASGAPADAKPDVSTDVEGVGGVDEASNEAASTADAQVDVEGIGGTGVEGVSADSTVSVDQGDEHSKNIEKIPTKTFDKGDSGVERQHDPVSTEVFTGEGEKSSSWQIESLESDPFPRPEDAPYQDSANPGTQPVDPVGKPDERVDLTDPTTTPDNNSGPTDTWSGTDGNGVTRQQDPTTNETLEGEDGVKSSTHLLTAMRLADMEVKMGLLDEGRKYARVEELEKLSYSDVKASLNYAEKVRTAARQGRIAGQTKTAMRVPSMARSSSEESESSDASSEEDVPVEAIFVR